uniref:Uncharacterized protein n=1 Tax=Romanomermis culicivorax TaxID=13658 RepID=A0A915IUT7_ROMCU
MRISTKLVARPPNSIWTSPHFVDKYFPTELPRQSMRRKLTIDGRNGYRNEVFANFFRISTRPMVVKWSIFR